MTADVLITLVGFLSIVVISLGFAFFVAHIFPRPLKSYLYRKTLSNLFVAGKVKQLAEKHDINLVEEYDSFQNFLKESRLKSQDLDDSIEEELQSSLNDEKPKDKKGK